MNVHSRSHDFGTGTDLYVKEIHTIEAIGKQPRVTVTQLARQAAVTKGAVSQIVNKLVDKGFVVKQRAETDNREIGLLLTDLGQVAFREHELVHRQVFEIVCDYYGDQVEQRLDMFIAALSDFNMIMKKVQQVRGVSDDA